MDLYGVGVKFGGTDDKWDLFNKYNCWFMGHVQGENKQLDNALQSVEKGDLLYVKAYGTTSQSDFYIRALGIVTDTELPSEIPNDYKDKKGFSVIWFKYFDEPISLTAREYNRGGHHTYTIFHEKNEKMIKKIIEMSKFNYTGEN